MNDELRAQILKKIEAKDSNELISIWIENDRAEWSDLTFEVIKEILMKRGLDLPIQKNPTYSHPKEDLEDWEVKLLDEEDQPEFYDTPEVLTLRDNLILASKIAIVIYVLQGIWNTQLIQAISQRSLSSLSDWRNIAFTSLYLLEIILKIA